MKTETKIIAAVVAFILGILLWADSAKAADIQILDTEIGPVVTFEGQIEVGDAERLDAIMTESGSDKVVMSSPGGNALEGYKIGGVLSSHEATVMVPEGFACISACANAFLGAKTYIVKGVLAFHVAWVDEDSARTLNSGVAAGQFLGTQSTIYFVSNGFSLELPMMINTFTTRDRFLVITSTEELLTFYVRNDNEGEVDAMGPYLAPSGHDAQWYLQRLMGTEGILTVLRTQRGVTTG